MGIEKWDIAKPGWTPLRDWMQGKIEEARVQLEGNNLPHEEAQFLRGRISAYRLLISEAQGDAAPAFETFIPYDQR